MLTAVTLSGRHHALDSREIQIIQIVEIVQAFWNPIFAARRLRIAVALDLLGNFLVLAVTLIIRKALQCAVQLIELGIVVVLRQGLALHKSHGFLTKRGNDRLRAVITSAIGSSSL